MSNLTNKYFFIFIVKLFILYKNRKIIITKKFMFETYQDFFNITTDIIMFLINIKDICDMIILMLIRNIYFINIFNDFKLLIIYF